MRCRHGREGVCLACGGETLRRGLEPIAGAIGGYFSRIDSVPSTPVDQGKWRRYDQNQVEQDALFTPFSDVATVTNPTHYREASITGKVGGQRMWARLPMQNFAGSDPNTLLLLDPRATPKDARRITRGQVDPWGSTVGKPSWTPGKMGQEAVSG